MRFLTSIVTTKTFSGTLPSVLKRSKRLPKPAITTGHLKMQANRMIPRKEGGNGALNHRHGFVTSRNQDLRHPTPLHRVVETRVAKVAKAEKPHLRPSDSHPRVLRLKIAQDRAPLSHPSHDGGGRLLRSNFRTLRRQIKRLDSVRNNFEHSAVCCLPGWSRSNCTSRHHRGDHVPRQHLPHLTVVCPRLKSSQGGPGRAKILEEDLSMRLKETQRVRMRGDR